MNFEQILNLLKAVREDQSNENLSQLLGRFQELIELQMEYQSLSNQEKPPSKEDQLEIVGKLTENLGQLKKDYSDFCQKTGKSPDELKQYFSNPQNFKPGAWEELQNFSRRFGLDSSTQVPKKKKKRSRPKKKWASI